MCKNIFIKHGANVDFLLKTLGGVYNIVYVINKRGTYIGQSSIDDYSALKYKIPKKFIGKTIWDLFPKKEADMYFDFALDTMHKNTPQEKYQTYSADGGIYEELFYNEPLKDKDNRIIGVIGKVIDIELLKSKVFNNSPRCLKTIINPNAITEHYFKDSISGKFNEIIFLLKKLELNLCSSNNDNLALIKQIKNLLKMLLYSGYNAKRDK